MRDYSRQSKDLFQVNSFILNYHFDIGMLRRDIFNLIFNKHLETVSSAVLPDPVVYTPDYVADGAPMEYSFTITMQSKDTPAFLQIGKVKLGLNKGCLFIASLISEREIHTGGKELELILTVSPQPNGGSYAKLIAKDQYGLTLSTLKSTQHLTSDWSGPIDLHKNFTSSPAEGGGLIETEPNQKTTL